MQYLLILPLLMACTHRPPPVLPAASIPLRIIETATLPSLQADYTALATRAGTPTLKARLDSLLLQPQLIRRVKAVSGTFTRRLLNPYLPVDSLSSTGAVLTLEIRYLEYPTPDVDEFRQTLQAVFASPWGPQPATWTDRLHLRATLAEYPSGRPLREWSVRAEQDKSLYGNSDPEWLFDECADQLLAGLLE